MRPYPPGPPLEVALGATPTAPHPPVGPSPRREPRPQPVLTPLTEAAIFLVLTVAPEGEETVRALLGDVAALSRSIGFRAPEAELTCVVGIGAGLFDRLFAAPRPAELHEFREIVGNDHTAVSTPGDLLFHVRSRRTDAYFELAMHLTARLRGAATVVDETHGFRYFEQRDLLGFVDGTENPVGVDAIEAVTIGVGDPLFAGGSYVVVQKYVHDLDAWNRLPTEQQEQVIGRAKQSDIELSGNRRRPDSHIALTTVLGPDGVQLQIVRDNMPFGRFTSDASEHEELGTYFVGYSATPATIEAMLDRMFVGDSAGNTDRLLGVSTAVTGSLFFVPSLDFLDDLPSPPSGRTSASTGVPGPLPHDGAPADGSLGIGALIQEPVTMNNLHRELAPISDVAWAGMEAEARRTFCEHIAGRRVVDVTEPAGLELAAVGTGHASDLPSSGGGVRIRRRDAVPVVELRVPFTVSRRAVDEATRGAKNVDWEPVKEAARELAFAEDRIIVDGLAAAGIHGIRTHPPRTSPTEVRDYPATIARALSALRLAAVAGPYRLLLSAPLHTLVMETADHGYPIRDHIARVLGSDGEIVWAPAIDGALAVSARGGGLRAASRSGRIHRLSGPRLGDRPAVHRGVDDLPGARRGGGRRPRLGRAPTSRPIGRATDRQPITSPAHRNVGAEASPHKE